jgi:predicted nucleic acid-binding Zn ribbon protein
MPVYRYKHDCGYEHDQFLNTDKDTILLKCERCGSNVSARQVRDRKAIIAENNEVKGILRHEGD